MVLINPSLIFKGQNNSQTAARVSLGTEFCSRLFPGTWSPSGFLFHQLLSWKHGYSSHRVRARKPEDSGGFLATTIPSHSHKVAPGSFCHQALFSSFSVRLAREGTWHPLPDSALLDCPSARNICGRVWLLLALIQAIPSPDLS